MRAGSTVRRRHKGGELQSPQKMAAAESPQFPQEGVHIEGPLRVDQRDRPHQAEMVDIARVWTYVHQVQVILDGNAAVAATQDHKAAAVYTVDEPDHPRLRIVKTASTTWARPGDLVDFMLRYENVGDQTVGNVVLVDNLDTRLEWIEGTAASSRSAEFRAKANRGGSSVLRWELADPLPPGKGGSVRFRCRVR